jgi:hypothetical protein
MPVAFCWLKGWEMNKKRIQEYGCSDPKKQIYGKCEHLQVYGDKRNELDPQQMQMIYETLIQDLAYRGVRIEGRAMNLVQAQPGGQKIKLSFEDAESKRRESIKVTKCVK